MPTQPETPPVLFHLKWVAKLALMVGVVATVGLLSAIFLITDDSGIDYAHVIASHSLTQQNLQVTLLVFGLALVLVACVATWLIALYSSFRIAGPLFRFSQNLKGLMDNALTMPQAIRKDDLLQAHWVQFDASQARLRAHYDDLQQALHAAEQALQPATDPAALTQALAKLKEVEQRVQL